MAELFDLTVADAGKRIREREISSVALVESLLDDRIGPLDPTLKAWVTIDREEVLGAAQRRDTELDEKGPPGPSPRHPHRSQRHILHERDEDHSWVENICGFRARLRRHFGGPPEGGGSDHPGESGHYRVRHGRPIPHPESLEPGSYPRRIEQRLVGGRGRTHVSCRPGLSDRWLDLQAAAYNGIVGLKATYGRISRYGVIPVSWSLDTVGILVRTVEDAAILLGAMAGHDPHDPSSSSEPVTDYRGRAGQSARTSEDRADTGIFPGTMRRRGAEAY